MATQAWKKRANAPQRLTGRKWQERRKRWLAEHPLCAMCEAKGRVTAGTVLDHVVPLAKNGADDESNFQTLCHTCHDHKSNDDRGYRTRPRIGADGWPINE